LAKANPLAFSAGKASQFSLRAIAVNVLYPCLCAWLIISASALCFVLLAKIYPPFLNYATRFLGSFPHREGRCLFCGGTSALYLLLERNFSGAWNANPFVCVFLASSVASLGLFTLFIVARLFIMTKALGGGKDLRKAIFWRRLWG